MKHKKITLPNGLRIIYIPAKSPAVTVMALVETGSNYEEKGENGLSHFLEHMMFKGTKSRPTSMDISKELDGLGAQSNAFTSNEMTAYWAKAEKKHFNKILEIVSDIYLNPTLPKEELEKERGVILQEISMYEDLPQRKVWDVFGELMYGDTPAGRTILGPAKNIKTFKKEDFENYRVKHYVAGKTIVIVSGDVSEKVVLDGVRKHFKDIRVGKKLGKDKVSSLQEGPKLKVFEKDTDQTHMILGFKTKVGGEKERLALGLLAGVLGKGMSSRLFQKLREEMGVCYYVRSEIGEYTDHSYFTISTGVDKNRVDEVVRALVDEVKKLKVGLVDEKELRKTKDLLIGGMYMGLETSDALAEYYLEQEVLHKRMKNPKELDKALRSITAKDLLRVANKFLTKEAANLAIVGDLKDASRLKKLLVL